MHVKQGQANIYDASGANKKAKQQAVSFVTMPPKGSRKRAGTTTATKPPAKKAKSAASIKSIKPAARQRSPTVEETSDDDDGQIHSKKHPRNPSHILEEELDESSDDEVVEVPKPAPEKTVEETAEEELGEI